MSKNKNCPFCGGKATFYPALSFQNVDKLFIEHKENCYLLKHGDETFVQIEYFKIDRWNTRNGKRKD